MPVIRSPSLHYTLKSSAGPYMGFLTGHDERLPFLKIFASYADGLYSDSDSEFRHFDDPQVSLSQWINSSPLLSDVEVFEPVSQCPPHLVSHPTHDDHYNSYDEQFDSNPFTWSYDGASSASGSMLPSFVSESGLTLNPLSPSISVTSSSPRSDNGVLSPPPLNEFSNVFDLDYSTSLPNESGTSTSHWRTIQPSTASPSPSPSCSSLDAVESKSTVSRDGSPSNSENDQNSRRRFPCLILGCTRRFTSQYTLKVHMEAHKPKPRTSFPCTLGCSERFSRQHDRLRHEVAKHGKVCEFLCDECGRFFSTKKTLGNHKCPVAQGSTRWVTG